MKDAAIIAAEEINTQGGVLGRPLKIVYEDTRGTPAEGRAAAERLVTENKAVAAFGEYHSPVALAEMEVFHKYGIPFMACDVYSDEITAKGYPEVFRNSVCISLLDLQVSDWMIAAKFRNVATLVEKDEIGIGAQRFIAAHLKKAGIMSTGVSADPNLTEFTSQILRFKNNQPPFDLLYTEFSHSGIYTLIRQSHDLGFAPTSRCGLYCAGGAPADPTFWENVGDAGKSLVAENVGLPKSAWNNKTRAFVDTFKQKFHEGTPPGAVMESYDAAWLLAEAIKSAGTTQPKSIIHALENTKWVGSRGQYSFSTSHNPPWQYHQFMEAPITLLQYDKVSQSEADAPVVWPRRYATVPYVYKRPV